MAKFLQVPMRNKNKQRGDIELGSTPHSPYHTDELGHDHHHHDSRGSSLDGPKPPSSLGSSSSAHPAGAGGSSSSPLKGKPKVPEGSTPGPWYLRAWRSLPWNKEEVEEKIVISDNEYKATEHLQTLEELTSTLGTQFDADDVTKSPGLPSAVAAQRILQDGKNILSPPKQTPEIIKFLKHFLNLFMLLLTFAGVLSCISYGLDRSQPINLYLGIILFIVVIMDCIIAYVQERNSSNVMKTFSKLLPQKCKVIRDGAEREVGAEELVRGDVVKFAIGDKIPADLRIVFSHQAKVECSSITGESLPITLTSEKTSERPTETRNLVFNGSLCLNGEAYGVVIRTGDNTLIGQIARLAGAQSERPTTMQVEVGRFVKFVFITSFIMAIIFFIVGMARGQGFLSTFVNGFIVVIVANVPQGLPATVTSVISIAAKKMAKKNVYVKRLDIVETLGATSLICSDKTGTLTQNLMSVVSFWFDNEFLAVSSTSSGMNTAFLVDLLEDPTFKQILQCASLCNRARYSDDSPNTPRISPTTTEHDLDPHHHHAHHDAHHDDDHNSEDDLHRTPGPESITKERLIIGDASDTAIFRFANHLGMAERIRNKYHKVFEIPFNSTIKYSVAIVDNPIFTESGVQRRHTLYIKGAPEIILEKCSSYLHKGEIKPASEEFLASVKAALRRSGVAGERVLAFAQTHLSEPQEEYSEDKANFPTTNLTFMGLVSLIDPPRPNVPGAIKVLKKANIKVAMVTGDHPITAESIARQVNIIGDHRTIAEVAALRGISVADVPINDPEVQAVVVTGMEIETLTDEQWAVILSKKEIVFARTTPTQKLQIVERNQAIGHVVAVTGDGVNDSPALKAANVGVAMGQMGSDVAREAADIILITDDFAAIVEAVKMGRLIFDNLKKTVAYTLAHLLPEMIPVLCTLSFSIPLGLSSILILFIDLGTELAPAISIAYEKPEPKIMTRKPRNTKTDRLVSYPLLIYSYIVAGLLISFVCFISYFLVFWSFGIPPSALPFTYETYWRPGAPDFKVGDLVFTEAEQLRIGASANTTWFLALVCCQFWHIWFVRTSRVSTFTRKPNNIVMIFGVIIEVCILVIVVYMPWLQPYIGTADPVPQLWAVNLIFLVIIGVYTETMKFIGTRHPKGMVSRHILW